MKRILLCIANVQFLILVFFIVGLENIQLPPLDSHDWRQVLTLSIAQNYLEFPNILFPRMDIGNETNGIIACEFPVFNYIIAFFFKVFGINHWAGRLVNWSVSCIGLWFFYDLVRKTLNDKAAFFALMAMMGSIVTEYARKSMPDTFALFLSLAGVWFLWRYLETQTLKHLLLGTLLTTLGILSKIPFVVVLAFLILPFSDDQLVWKAKLKVMLSMGVSMLCVGFWYYYWMPFLLQNFRNQLIWPVSLEEGMQIITNLHAQESWQQLLSSPFHYKIPFLFSIMGMGALWTTGDIKLKWFTLVYTCLYFVFVLKTGIVFPTHEYYIIPLVPLIALFFGFLLNQLHWKWGYTTLLAVIILVPGFMYNRSHSFSPIPNRAYLSTLPGVMDQYTQPNDKIMVNGGPFNPVIMYWAKRKGWTVNQDVPTKTEWMPEFRKQGLKFILMDRHLSDETLPYFLLYEDVNFRLYGFEYQNGNSIIQNNILGSNAQIIY